MTKERKKAAADFLSDRNPHERDNAPLMNGKKKWMQNAVKHPGALTRQAKAAGEGVQEFAREHASDSGTTGKRARLALTFKKFNK